MLTQKDVKYMSSALLGIPLVERYMNRELSQIWYGWLQEIVKKSMVYCEYSRQKTLSLEHVQQSWRNLQPYAQFQLAASRLKKLIVPFSRVQKQVKISIKKNGYNNIRVSRGAVLLIQSWLEINLLNLLSTVQAILETCGKSTMKAKHIQAARKVMNPVNRTYGGAADAYLVESQSRLE
jgi:histone H3/H4